MKYFWNYIYAPFALGLILFWTMLCSAAAFFVSFSSNKNRQNTVIAIWSKFIVYLLRADIEIIDKKYLPASGCLLLFNHLSLIDIPLIFHALGSDFRFGAKIELFRIPIFGQALRRCHFLPIERANRNSTFKTYAKAKERCQKGERFILAPEGTRQSQLKLGSFKSGPFILGIQAEIPLIPIVIAGPEKICPKNKIIPILDRKITLKVKVLEPISTKGYQLEDRNKLKDLTWKKMDSALKDL